MSIASTTLQTTAASQAPPPTAPKRKATTHEKKKKPDKYLVSGTSEESDEFTFDIDSDEWTMQNFEEYLRREKLRRPKLLRIEERHRSLVLPRTARLGKYFCVFEHLTTKKEVPIWVKGVVLSKIDDYTTGLMRFDEMHPWEE